MCERRKEEIREKNEKKREKWKNKLKAIETESDDWTRINKRVIFIDVYRTAEPQNSIVQLGTHKHTLIICIYTIFVVNGFSRRCVAFSHFCWLRSECHFVIIITLFNIDGVWVCVCVWVWVFTLSHSLHQDTLCVCNSVIV